MVAMLILVGIALVLLVRAVEPAGRPPGVSAE